MHLLFLLVAFMTTESFAAECIARSGPQTAALVELYTSEGCSSCPPADRWLSSFTKPGAQRVVPIAFHVSYWDYIGWKDLFADERYTERQRALAKATGARMVYTPQVMLSGRDLRDWSSARAFAASVERLNATAARAQLELTPQATADGTISGAAMARLLPGTRKDDLALFVVVTQNGLSSRVTAGENRGEKLAHDFVVRDLVVSRDFDSVQSIRAPFSFKPRAGWNLERMAVAAFLQNLRTGEVLQALSAPICRG
jgi:hypothetical protein